jgi:hypothetical protein
VRLLLRGARKGAKQERPDGNDGALIPLVCVLDLFPKQHVLIIINKIHQQQKLQTTARDVVDDVLRVPVQASRVSAREVQAAKSTANRRL